MKPVLPILLLAAFGTSADAQPEARANAPSSAQFPAAIDAPWTATISKSDRTKLHINIIENRHGTLGTSVPIAELSGLTAEELQGTGRPVTFVLRRESGTITFSGRFADGTGQGTLHYVSDPGFFARVAAMGVRNDLNTERTNVLALPMLDVRTDYIAALRNEGALADLSDYVGMRAVGVRPEMVHELKPLIEGPLRAHDMMALAALGVTPDYVRQMRGAYRTLTASDLSSMKAMGVKPDDIARFKAIGFDVSPQDATGLKALGVTPDYVAEMRAAGARIRTAEDAQSFRALGISAAAVKRAVAHGRPNPSASEVMEANVRF
jgi:hypothetical protein